jgi:hypothetical protein
MKSGAFNFFCAGWCGSAALTDASRGDAWMALLLCVFAAANLIMALEIRRRPA